MNKIGTVACEYCKSPITVVAFDLMPGRYGQRAHCGTCGKESGLPFVAGVIGFFLGIVSGVYIARTAIHEAEQLFGAPVSGGVFSLIFVASLAAWAFVTVQVTRSLYRFTWAGRSG